jgi:hypothetical protein
VYDSSGNSAGDSVLVSVVDTTSPTINHPSDLIYEIGTTGHTIEWTPSDLYPGSYQILRNGVPIVSGSWDGSSISVSVDGLAGGTYNYTIIVADSSGNLVIDSVSVAVLGETTLTTTPTTTTTPTIPLGDPTMIIVIVGAGGAVVIIIIIVYIFKKKGK